MTPPKVNNHTMEDLVDNEGDESTVAEVRRMTTKMFKFLNRTYKNNSMKRIQTF
jgi:hypothetical protein